MSSCWNSLSDPDLSNAAKVVFCALVELSINHPPRRFDEHKLRIGQVAITIKQLSQSIHVNHKTVSKCVRQLEGKGLLKIGLQEKYFGCCYKERVYQILAVGASHSLN